VPVIAPDVGPTRQHLHDAAAKGYERRARSRRAEWALNATNTRALRRDLNERFDDVQARLEKQANALADELLARTKDTKE
jgi:hypothetical protein